MIRRTWRGFAGVPAYGVALVVTLGLGVAVASATVTVGAGVFLRPLPHHEAGRLVHVRQTALRAGLDNALLSVPEIRDLRSGVSGFESVVEYSSMRFTVLGMDRPRRVHAGVVTGSYFGVLGLEAVRGRLVRPSDDGDVSAVAVLTRSFWSRAFGGDEAVVGRTLTMNGRSVTVVGVVEEHPPFPDRIDVYVNMSASPHHLGATMNHDRTHRMTEAFARLAPGARVDAVRREVEAVMARGRAAHAEAYDPGYGWGVSVATLEDRMTRRARPVLALLGGVAGLVVLIVVANVLGLGLTRAVRLADELAVRTALGASISDLRRRLLEENLVLGSAGSLVGLALAWPGGVLLSHWLARYTPRAEDLSVDAAGLAAGLAVGVGTALLLTFAAPVQRGRVALGRVRTGRGGGGGRSAGPQKALVILQVAVSFVLFVGAGLLLRTLLHLEAVDVGLDTDGVIVMELPPVLNGRTATEIRRDHEAVVEAVASLPGVTSAGLTNRAPLREGEVILPWTLDVRVEDGPEPLEGDALRADFRTATPGLLGTLGVPLVEGRGIGTTDVPGAAPVALVNRAFVRRYLDGGRPLGRRVAWTGDIPRLLGIAREWREIVGVVEDVRDHGPDQEPRPAIYVPWAQESFGDVLLFRGIGDVEKRVASALAAVRSVVPDQPVENVATMEAVRAETLGDRALNARLVGALAFLALGVAAAGLFGLLTYRVGTRQRELGVHMALGADPWRVVGLVVREGLRLVAAGGLLGGLVAYTAAGAVGHLLYGVEPSDAATLGSGVVLLTALAVLTSALPAYRATRVAPARVLGSP